MLLSALARRTAQSNADCKTRSRVLLDKASVLCLRRWNACEQRGLLCPRSGATLFPGGDVFS